MEIRGAALDVLEKEPPDWSKTPQQENLILTPHAAFYSESSFKELKRRTAQSSICSRCFAGESYIKFI
jgi:D-3-phosphoglycerate dehydrogenase